MFFFYYDSIEEWKKDDLIIDVLEFLDVLFFFFSFVGLYLITSLIILIIQSGN